MFTKNTGHAQPRRWVAGLLALLVLLSGSAAVVAWACGADFPQLLSRRVSALKAVVRIDFLTEVPQFVARPHDKIQARLDTQTEALARARVEADANAAAAADPASPTLPHAPQAPQAPTLSARERAEQMGLSSAQKTALAAARAAPDGDAAYAAGAGLPEAARHYAAAAVDFLRHQNGPPALCNEADGEPPSAAQRACAVQLKAQAAAYNAAKPQLLVRSAARLRQLLSLPTAKAAPRATWAAFMLGRISDLQGDGAAASAYFQRTRALANQGAPDPLGLALASLGDEARVLFNAHNAAQALALYAEQAARGDASGKASMRLAVERTVADPTQLKSAVTSPLGRRVLLSYALSLGARDWVPDGAVAPAAVAAPLAPQASAAAASSALATAPPAGAARVRNSVAARLLAALQAQGLDQLAPDERDRVAALAYAAGQFDVALQLAQGTPGPLAPWIEAKLLVRQGQYKPAAAAYSRAVQALAQNDAQEVHDARVGTAAVRLRAEQGVLSLAQGDFTLALQQLYAEGRTYWVDLAYVAERVVTVDELRSFVDAQVPPRDPVPPASAASAASATESEDIWLAHNVALQLRDLLARRLVREGRHADAAAYFHPRGEPGFAEGDARAQAQAYAAALASGKGAYTRVGQAQALYQAAATARHNGMEIMGYELAPDYFVSGGSAYVGGYEQPATTPANLATAQEQQRVAAQGPPHDRRYTYRYIAAGLAVQSAALLPPRSQAFAATLCRASRWMQDAGEMAESRALYRRYVREGAYQPWARQFGRSCPEPEFWGARLWPLKVQWRVAQHQVMRHPRRAMAGAGLAVLLLGVGGWVWWRRGRAARLRAAGAAGVGVGVGAAP